MQPSTFGKNLASALALRRSGVRRVWPRYASFALGVWLQISAFVLPHTDESRVSAWLPGTLISVVALLALGTPPMRWLNGLFALWLLAWTAVATSTTPLAFYTGTLVGVLVFACSLVPSSSVVDPRSSTRH
jgi:ABC-type multidrug transport system fused ATPase/permease subunit